MFVNEFTAMLGMSFFIMIVAGVLFVIDTFKKAPPDLPLGEDDIPVAVEVEAADDAD